MASGLPASLPQAFDDFQVVFLGSSHGWLLALVALGIMALGLMVLGAFILMMYFATKKVAAEEKTTHHENNKNSQNTAMDVGLRRRRTNQTSAAASACGAPESSGPPLIAEREHAPSARPPPTAPPAPTPSEPSAAPNVAINVGATPGSAPPGVASTPTTFSTPMPASSVNLNLEQWVSHFESMYKRDSLSQLCKVRGLQSSGLKRDIARRLAIHEIAHNLASRQQ